MLSKVQLKKSSILFTNLCCISLHFSLILIIPTIKAKALDIFRYGILYSYDFVKGVNPQSWHTASETLQ